MKKIILLFLMLGLSKLTFGQEAIQLSWNASTDNVGVAGYRVWVDGGVIGTTTDTFYIPSLNQGIYDLTVSAFDAAGNESAQSYPLNISIRDTLPPTIPGNLRITFISSGSDPEPKPFGQDPSLYEALVFSDEFETDTLDTSKWDHHLYSGWITNPYKNWHFENGELHIWPRYDNGKFWDRNFETSKTFRQLYGYFEIECKMPIGAGIKPAFWLYNADDVNGRFRPEIDIFESYGYTQASTLKWNDDNLHLTSYEATVWLVDELSSNKIGHYRFYEYFEPRDLSMEYHIYGCRWDMEGIIFYFDGQQLGPKIETNLINLPMFIDLRLRYSDQAERGSGVLSRSNPYTPEGKNNPFVIKYVRVWNLE